MKVYINFNYGKTLTELETKENQKMSPKPDSNKYTWIKEKEYFIF